MKPVKRAAAEAVFGACPVGPAAKAAGFLQSFLSGAIKDGGKAGAASADAAFASLSRCAMPKRAVCKSVRDPLAKAAARLYEWRIR